MNNIIIFFGLFINDVVVLYVLGFLNMYIDFGKKVC